MSKKIQKLLKIREAAEMLSACPSVVLTKEGKPGNAKALGQKRQTQSNNNQQTRG